VEEGGIKALREEGSAYCLRSELGEGLLEYRAELWGKISEVYPLVTKEQRQKHREILGEMIENKKRESKRELRNLQSSVNYGDIKASSKCRRDKANRS
jgi:hypothetical protein